MLSLRTINSQEVTSNAEDQQGLKKRQLVYDYSCTNTATLKYTNSFLNTLLFMQVAKVMVRALFMVAFLVFYVYGTLNCR